MSKLLMDLAVGYLKRKNASVIIGCEMEGGKVKFPEEYMYIHKNGFANTRFYTANEEEFQVPKGKFTIKY